MLKVDPFLSSLWRCAFISAVFSAGEVSHAAVVRNILLPTDQAFSTQMQHSCGVYILQPGPHWCNPALFPFVEDGPIKGDVAIGADHDAYETTDRLLNQPITKEFVDDLFKNNDFQAFSGLARLEAISSFISFAYIPAYAVGAYKLSNPNLPEVDAAAMKESQFRVTSGAKLLSLSSWDLYGGAGIYLYDQTYYYIRTNALELIVRDIDALLIKERKRGVDGDVGFFLNDTTSRFPDVAVVSTNVFNSQEKEIGQEQSLSLEPNFRRKTRVHAGYSLSNNFGSYFLGGQIPFWDAFREYDRLSTSASFVYGVGRLRMFTSFSPLMSSFGFLFMSSHYHVGIQYTNEKQDNSLELRRRKNVNLFLSLIF